MVPPTLSCPPDSLYFWPYLSLSSSTSIATFIYQARFAYIDVSFLLVVPRIKIATSNLKVSLLFLQMLGTFLSENENNLIQKLVPFSLFYKQNWSPKIDVLGPKFWTNTLTFVDQFLPINKSDRGSILILLR